MVMAEQVVLLLLSTSTCWQWSVGQMGRLPKAAAGKSACLL